MTTVHLRVLPEPEGAESVPSAGIPTPAPVDPGRCRLVVVEPDPEVRRTLGDRLPSADRSATLDDLDLAGDRPAVVVVGPGCADGPGLAALADVTSAHPRLAAVVVVDGYTTDTLQAAMRAGARDVVELDPTGDGVTRAVARVATGLLAALPSPPTVAAGAVHAPPGRIVAVFSPRGGVGKTVVATNVAAALARVSGGTVALADADLQYGDVAVVLGLPPEHSIVDAAGAAPGDDPAVVRDLMVRDESGVLVLPAPREPMMGLALAPDDVDDVCRQLRRIAAVTVVDVPSVFDDATFALLEAADEILLVASMDIPSIKNLKIGLQAYDLVGLVGPKLRLVLNRANASVKLDPREIERVLGIPVAFPVPYDLAVPRAVNAGVPVVRHAPRSAATRAFEHIARSLVGPDAARVRAGRSGRRRRRER